MNDFAKICYQCKNLKSFSLFNKLTKSKDGLQAKCKDCEKAYQQENKEKIKLRRKQYREKNKEKINKAITAWQRKNKDKQKVAKKKYLLSEKGKEKNKTYNQKYRKENKDFVSKLKKEWAKINSDRACFYSSNRRASMVNATPDWASKTKILEFYETAKGMSMLTGDWYHVDHIVPLKSKFVCGLHCEQNLQILPRVVNLKKTNLFWPDMP